MVRETGFTLLEMALSVLLMSILISSSFPLIQKMMERQRWHETQNTLNVAQKAVIGFMLKHGRLPCPDTDNDGVENNDNGFCDSDTQVNPNRVVYGSLPYLDVGTHPTDSYGLSIQYAVTQHYADTVRINAQTPVDPSTIAGYPCALPLDVPGRIVKASFNTCSSGAITVRDELDQNIAVDIPYMIWSAGKNGRAHINDLDRHERTNKQANRLFVLRPNVNSESLFFDDQLQWLPSSMLVLHLFEANMLP